MKRYILPSLKLLLFLVIAVALTKIAFFPSQSQGQNQATLDPSYTVVIPTVTVEKGDITNTVDVAGQIVEDAPVSAPATANATVARLIYENGDTVSAGESIMTLAEVTEQDPIVSTDEEGNETVTEQDPVTKYTEVYAPISGIVRYSVIKDQETSVGSSVATISPGTFSAVGTITAEEQYRLTDPPSEAEVTINEGPAPFGCSNLKIGTETDTATDEEGDYTPSDGTSVKVRCAVPVDQTVFPGLTATIGISSGSVTDALVVPVTAVEGSFDTGNVWLLSDPEDPESAVETEVVLGITDGMNIQITDGLKEGDTILMNVPGKDVVRTGEPNTCEPDGSVCYDENGEEYM